MRLSVDNLRRGNDKLEDDIDCAPASSSSLISAEGVTGSSSLDGSSLICSPLTLAGALAMISSTTSSLLGLTGCVSTIVVSDSVARRCACERYMTDTCC